MQRRWSYCDASLTAVPTQDHESTTCGNAGYEQHESSFASPLAFGNPGQSRRDTPVYPDPLEYKAMFAARPFALNTAPVGQASAAARASTTKTTTTIKG